MKEYFKTEAEKTITDIKKARSEGDLCFALLSDSHLCDESTETCENISAVDKEINFDFIAHLGNITNGDNPEKITRWLMQNEIEKFKNTISAKKILIK